MAMPPKISVVMSVYNGRRFLRQAVDSVLAQTFPDFEFIIIDDGSTDATAVILGSFDDPRIVVLRNNVNIGLTSSLNCGFDAAKGEFIARFDADDIALPERLEKQAAFLDANQEIGILGSCCRLIDAKGLVRGQAEAPLSDIAIRWRGLTGNPFFHPSVMIRRSLIERHGLRYDETFATAQDYELWLRLLEHTKGANLEDRLVSLRRHGDSVSRRRKNRQSADHDKIALGAISAIWPGHPLTPALFPLLRRLVTELAAPEGYADTHRISLLGFYAELLGRFAEKHRGAKGLAALCRRERILIAYTAFKAPWRPGLLELLARLVAADLLLPVFGVMWLARGAMCRLVCRRR